MPSDLEIAVKSLQEKQDHHDRMWQYYDGNQPLRYSTERLKVVFKKLKARFTENWCEVVVASVLERLDLEQFWVMADDAATRLMTDWWKSSGMLIDADDVHLCALVTGEAFVLVWPDEDGVLEAYYNDSRLCHVQYSNENPRQMRFAAKWWDADDDTARLTLYYPESLVNYRATVPLSKAKKANAFTRVDDDMVENPLGIIPVFHFRRERRAIKSELGPSVLDLQDAINKLFSDLMVSAEFSAFRQRYIISHADVGALKNAPNEVWDIPAGDGLGQDTNVGEFGEHGLDNFLRAMEHFSVAISRVSRTPQSYFFLGARADPSGEALIAMENPLNDKVRKYQKRFKDTWEQLAALVLKISREPIRAIYEDPRTVQPLTQAQTRDTNVRAGIPLKTQLRREGWTPRELDNLEADKQAEATSSQNSLATALLASQRGFDSGVTGG